MELKHDCVRNVLLTMESLELGLMITRENFSNKPLLESYDIDDVAYTVAKLKEAGFIEGRYSPTTSGSYFHVSSITWSGHHFLDNIRDDKIWSATKKTASKVTGASLSILSEIATSMVKKSLGLE